MRRPCFLFATAFLVSFVLLPPGFRGEHLPGASLLTFAAAAEDPVLSAEDPNASAKPSLPQENGMLIFSGDAPGSGDGDIPSEDPAAQEFPEEGKEGNAQEASLILLQDGDGPSAAQGQESIPAEGLFPEEDAVLDAPTDPLPLLEEAPADGGAGSPLDSAELAQLVSLVESGFTVTNEMMVLQAGLLALLLALFVFQFVHRLISHLVTKF